MLRNPKVLLLSNDETETAVLEQLLNEHVAVTPVNNLSELGALLENSDYDALFCAGSPDTGICNDALEEVRNVLPDLPVILLSSSAEQREWLQALDAGAFDVLVPPYQERALLAVLEQASASREAVTSRRIAWLSEARV